MTTALDRGAYAGRETKLYYNSASHDAPTMVEIKRARNVQTNNGPSLNEIEFHGQGETGNIPGYRAFSGSFEYVKRRGADPVFAALEAIQQANDLVELEYLNDDISVDGAKGWRAPVLLGEFQETSNGADGVVVTIPFAKADCFDSGGTAVDVTYPTIGS